MDNSIQITDEELRQELERMGYTNIPEDVLKLFKSDLEELMRLEQVNPTSPPDSLSPRVINTAPVCLNQLHKDSPVKKIDNAFPEMTNSSKVAAHNAHNSKKVSAGPLTVPKTRCHSAGQRSLLSVSSERSCASSASGSTPRVIKRKVLRHKDGESFVEETSYISNISSNAGDYAAQAHVQSPPCPDFSYGLQRSKQISRSTGSLNGLGQSGVRKQVRMPSVQYGVKQCDPVTRYHLYTQFWKAFKPPGEKSHKKLRWTIREQMMDYDPLVEISLKQIPNMYKIPMERRRPMSRSASSSSLYRQTEHL